MKHVDNGMLTVYNFESEVNPTILQRGRQYYQNKAIVWAEEVDANTWEAEVEGTDLYHVELQIGDKGEVRDLSCDCPYEGEVCKHTVAVLFTIQKKFKPKTSKKSVKKPPKNILDSLLQAVSAEEMQGFVRYYAANNRDFKNAFELYFANKDERIDISKQYKANFQQLLRQHSSRGFMDYRGTSAFSKEIEKQLQHADDLVTKQNFSDAFAIASAALRISLKAATQCDDSAGNIGELFYHLAELFGTLAHHETVAMDLKEKIYVYLEKELKSSDYFGYGDIGYDLFGTYADLALLFHKHDAFLAFIEVQLSQLNGPYDNYSKTFFLTQKIDFLTLIGRTTEAEAVIQQHMDLSNIRESVVEKAIEDRDYEQAKELISEGIAIAEGKNHAGTVDSWQKTLLRIAELENDVPTIRRYAQHFALSRWFDKEYYNQWKATYTQAEWQAVITQYIAETISKIEGQWEAGKRKYNWQGEPPLLERLGPTYVQEAYWQELLQLVQKESQLHNLIAYNAYLAPRYPQEMLKLYVAAFAKVCVQANSRSNYANLAYKMQQVMLELPEAREEILALALQLQEQYPRRKAMIEEFNKILFKKK
ncbi:SWIM zinc finger family protein [Pontibacter rugosus]|uniref:SWIM zinc finger domain-containing protein n=1 Tax=Pontibacter rugosus TaxID=1745966 RepID=A0ABW3SY57_9BACT